MKNLLLILALLAFLPVVAQSPDENPSQANPKRHEALKAQGAHLRLMTTDHDFGTVNRRGGDLEYRLVVTNDGTSPLVLTRVITSCSCLKSNFSKRPLAVGEEMVITLTYEPLKAEPGAFHKVVQILSNSSSGREFFTIRGKAY